MRNPRVGKAKGVKAPRTRYALVARPGPQGANGVLYTQLYHTHSVVVQHGAVKRDVSILLSFD